MPVLIEGPDGVLRANLVFSTTVARRFFSGTIPAETVDLQISINNSGWSSDPSLSDWGDGVFTVPNPVHDPDGVALLSGTNTVAIRAVLPSGSTTPVATATIMVVSEDASGVVSYPPTNITVLQENGSVTISAEPGDTTGFRGMNFYASRSAGGGTEGYARINLNLVTAGTTETESSSFGAIDLDADVAVDGDDVPLADPQYFRLIARQEDQSNVLLQGDLDERFVIPETTRTLRFVGEVFATRSFTVYSFSHSRSAGRDSNPATIPVGSLSSCPIEQPLYYVVTAVYYDSVTNTEIESSYSAEVVAHPVTVTDALGSLPTVDRQGIVQEFITSIFRSNPQIRVEPGSVLRDTVIDPFSSEAERVRFLLDFFNRARSPALLLQVDDPSGSGVSIPVADSSYKKALKQALYMTSDVSVQALIDSAFDAYASNLGVRRRVGTSSQGTVTFSTNRRPTQSILFPIGTVVSGGAIDFATTRAVSIDFARIGSFYDPISGRYRVSAPVRATVTGSRTNVGRGQVTRLQTSVPGGITVTNTAAMFGGLDLESNLSLVTRAKSRIASVDTGTAQGYQQTAADVAGVVKANVVSAGDPLMLRDMDTSGNHWGGKVDVWVQGGTDSTVTVTDTFAFSYSISRDIQFDVIGDAADLTFRARDTSLSESDPIVEMLDFPSAGYEMVNATTGEAFDLTGVEILSYNTISLSTAVAQPTVALSDVVLGSFRKRIGDSFVLPRQPVQSITSVVGTVAGGLASSDYTLIHTQSPLGVGRSVEAGDELVVSAGASGDFISVTGESHVLLGAYPEYLDNLGANFLTIHVWNSDRTIEYVGPNDPPGSPDYEISVGTQTVAVSITRVETGAIASGETVLIDYEHDENFTVTYVTDQIVSLTQDAIDASKHATADVLVKQGVPVPLDISATVVFRKGRDPGVVDEALKTNLANFFVGLRLDGPVRQSDVIAVIEKTEGVSYVVVPLAKMVRQEGSTVVREIVSTDTAAESVFLSSLSSPVSSTYLLVNALSAATTDGGGPDGSFRDVTQDDQALVMVTPPSALSALSIASGRAYIIGSEGASIQGYSDDATLTAAGYTTAATREARRIVLTANRIVVSMPIGDEPTLHSYATTYIVGVDSGAKDIDPGAAEYITSGTLDFTYDEDR